MKLVLALLGVVSFHFVLCQIMNDDDIIDNPGMIGVAQPRRAAAISMEARVAHELSLTSSRISFQIRYDATVSLSTSTKFMTDGVLLRELTTDFFAHKVLGHHRRRGA